MLKINIQSIIKISLLLAIIISYNFDLNNSLNKYFIVFEDIFYFIFFIGSLICYFKSKILAKLFEEKTELLFIIILIFIQLIFLDKNSYKNDIKLIIYTLPLIFLSNFKDLKDIINLNFILNIFKFFLITTFVLIFFELGIYHFYQKTLIELIFRVANDGILINSNIDLNIIKEDFNQNKSKFFDINSSKERLGFRPELFLSNPITIFINFLLASMFILFYKKRNILKIFISTLIIAILCKTRLIMVVPLLYLNNFSINMKRLRLALLFIFIILLIYYFLMYKFNILNNFKIEKIYNSRITFYIQYFSQFKITDLIFPNNSIYFFNEEGNITGPHSDFIYLSINYGLMFAIYFYFIIYRVLKKLGILLAIILLISLINGLIFSSFFWIFLYLFSIHVSFNNYSHNK